MSFTGPEHASRVRTSTLSNASIQPDEHIVCIPPSPVRSHFSRKSQLSPQQSRASRVSRAASSKRSRRTTHDDSDDDDYFGIAAPQSTRYKGRRHLRDGAAAESGLYKGAGSVTWLGRVYEAIWSFSLVTRYMIYVLPLGLLLSIPIFVGAFGAEDAALGGVRIMWTFIWVEIVWFSLWIAKLLAKILPIVFETIVGVINNSVTKYALILVALEMPITLVAWTFTSWVTFIPIMTGNPDQRRLNDRATKSWEDRLNKVLAALLIGSILLLIERFVIQLLSVNYHGKQFALRIKQYKRHIYLFTRLFDISRAIFPLYCPEFLEEDYIIMAGMAAELVTPGAGKHGQSKAMKIIGNIGRVGDKFTSAIGNVAHEITGNKKIFAPQSAKAIVTNALEHKAASEALAKRVWMSLVSENKEELDLADLQDVFTTHADDNAEEPAELADECMAMLDRDSNGDVSLDEIVLMFLELGREKKSVARSMHDVDNAIDVLNNVLTTIVLLAAIFILIALLNQNFGTMLATAGTVLLSLSFVFALTAQEFLSSCIFLFVKHPYDVGDRIDIDNKKYIVEHISLLFTVFRRVDTHKNVQVPNSVLNTLWVENVSRSLAMQDVILIQAHFDTTMDDIEILRDHLLAFVNANSRDFHPDVAVDVSDVPSLDRVEIRFAVRHKSNMANEGLRRQRRNRFIFELIAACKKVPIYPPNVGDPDLGTFGQPTYSVMVSDHEAQERWAKAQKDKADMRFKKPAPETDVASARSTGIWSTDPRIAELAATGVVIETQESLGRQTTTGRRKPGGGSSALSPHVTNEKRPELSQD
ncbi:Mechanosensitive ion channel-domain-containing protein [Lipomyces tetrasporus]|uniref:Mechanosensitive ion channel protein n=1 Tax=Lipomyces tetrasporus TaxID=54092 RepID=A0AAD7QL99_9ASCO|nr:Mechanosensitive ion channel-domain-containing protein [Lipomyces tetrasporus]KAJ8097214.1 Mechanosensitive ion channel-domain-containing protein [Lipomyces tetrasporus]